MKSLTFAIALSLAVIYNLVLPSDAVVASCYVCAEKTACAGAESGLGAKTACEAADANVCITTYEPDGAVATKKCDKLPAELPAAEVHDKEGSKCNTADCNLHKLRITKCHVCTGDECGTDKEVEKPCTEADNYCTIVVDGGALKSRGCAPMAAAKPCADEVAETCTCFDKNSCNTGKVTAVGPTPAETTDSAHHTVLAPALAVVTALMTLLAFRG